MEKEKKKYLTVQELFLSAIQKAHEDPRYQEALDWCPLDYSSIPASIANEKVECCAFDTIGCTFFGSNEGIYGVVIFRGKWRHSHKGSDEVFTLKTLRTDKESYIGMSMLVALICYHLDQYVRDNLDRLD